MANVLAERIKERLAALDMTARGASIRAGLGPDAIRSIFNGSSKSPRAHTLSALAAALECDVNYLLGNSDDPGAADAAAPIIQIPDALICRNVLETGAWRAVRVRPSPAVPEIIAQTEPLWEFSSVLQWLELLDDDSMDLIFPRGTFVHVISPEEAGWSLNRHDLVIVERRRFADKELVTERTLRQYDLDANGSPVVDARSTNRDHNVRWPVNEPGSSYFPDRDLAQVVGVVIRGLIPPPGRIPKGYWSKRPSPDVPYFAVRKRSNNQAATIALLKANLRGIGVTPPKNIEELDAAVAALPEISERTGTNLNTNLLMLADASLIDRHARETYKTWGENLTVKLREMNVSDHFISEFLSRLLELPRILARDT